jgi:hypothetical protein
MSTTTTNTNSTVGRRRGARATAGLALLVLALPASAVARPLGPDGEFADQMPTVSAIGSPTVAASRSGVTPVVIVRDGGFDWSDAAIGAAAASGVIALFGAGLIATTRGRREHTPHAAH